MSVQIGPELLTYIAAVSAKLAELPKSPTFGGGEFYVTNLSVRWSDGHATEQLGVFEVNDFDGFDFLGEYKDLTPGGGS